MNRSSKFNFFLPQNTDPIDVSDFNSNFETIDANLLTKAQSLTEAQKAAVRANAGLNVANNLTTTEAGSVLDARMGKALNEKTSTAIALIAGSSRSEILSNIDALVSGTGQAFFYMAPSTAELAGLERQTYFCTLACQNANVRVISAVRGGLADAVTLQRTSSGWASSWLSLNSKVSKSIVSYTYDYTISANGNLSITAGQMGMSSPPNGYNAVGLAVYNTGNVNVVARGINAIETISGNNCVWLHNLTNSQQSGTMTVGVLNLKF